MVGSRSEKKSQSSPKFRDNGARNIAKYTLPRESWAVTLFCCIFAGLVVAGAYGLRDGVFGGASAILLSGACLVLGGLVGFLFAIPRYLRVESAAEVPSDGSLGVHYDSNDNLVQISDWLTKIMVGVGLTKVSTMPEFLGRFGRYFGPSLGVNADFIAVVVLLYFSSCGFLMGYLWTRIVFAGKLYQADTDNREIVARSLSYERDIEVERLYFRATTEESTGRYASAEVFFKKIIELDPTHLKAKAGLADCYLSWTDAPQRPELLTKALKLCSEYESVEITAEQKGGILLIRAAIQLATGDRAASLRILKESIIKFREGGIEDEAVLSFIRADKTLLAAITDDREFQKIADSLEARR